MDNAIQRLREAIIETQKNVKFQPVEDTPDGNSYTLQPDVSVFDHFTILLLFTRNCSKLAIKFRNI